MNFLNFPKLLLGNIYEKIYNYCLVCENEQVKKDQRLTKQSNSFNQLFLSQKDFRANHYSLRGCVTSRYNHSFKNKRGGLFTYRKIINDPKPFSLEYLGSFEKKRKLFNDNNSDFWLNLSQNSIVNIYSPNETKNTPQKSIHSKSKNESELKRNDYKGHANLAKYKIPILDLKSAEKRNSDLPTYREHFPSNKNIVPTTCNSRNKELKSGRKLQTDWANVSMLIWSACHDRTIQKTKVKIELVTLYTIENSLKQLDPKLHIIEEGSFGRVYKGRYLGNDVAVKVPNLDTMKSDPLGVTERILREWKLLAKIEHPNIISFKGGIILPNKHIWLVTEFIRGCDLHSLKYKFKYEIPIRKAIKMIKQLVRALDFLHTPTKEKGIIIHRDIKPENIIIDNKNWNIYLCDFGDAEEFGSGNKRRLSGATWLYSPIELLSADPLGNHILIQNTSQYNEKWDIWSLGCVLQEFFGNTNPFEHIVDFKDNSNQIYSKLVKAVREKKYIPKIPTNLHPQIKKIIELCLQPDPRLRPSTKFILKMLDNVF